MHKALLAVEMAQLACKDELEIAEALDDYQYIDVDPIQGFVGRLEDTTIIAFKGTDRHIADWAVNINFTKVPMAGFAGYVHEGFLEAFISVKDEVSNAFEKIFCLDDTVVITGHSQGAALAQICAAIMFNWKGTAEFVPEVHLFGSPRVGDKKYAAVFNAYFDNTYDWINNNDVVVRVPFGNHPILHRLLPFARFLPMGFCRVGRKMYFDRNRELVENPSWGKLFCDRLAGRFMNWKHWLNDGSLDHSITHYFNLVNKAMKVE